jgi:hypothetical protein
MRVASAALLALASACGAPSPPRLSALHALGYSVREPDRDGWILVEAPDRGYRFLLPDVPEVEDGRSQTVFELWFPDHVYVVNVWHVGRWRTRSDAQLARTRDAYVRGMGATIVSETATTHAGHPAIDLVLSVGSEHLGAVSVRIVDGGENVFGLALRQTRDRGAYAEDLERFRSSLALADP